MRGTETDLRQLIEGGTTARGEPVSKLGYFCAPFRPAAGPFADDVIKVYRSRASAAELDRLAIAHAAYVAAIRDSGVTLPETHFLLLETEGARVPVVVQAALPPESMMRPQMIAADLDGALALMEAAGEVIATFWAAVADRPERIGFHPSIRNLAVIDGQGIFFDTFPPLIGYSRDEMGRLLITYSGSALMRMVGPLLRARVTGIQDEWYSPPETLIGLVGSACRLRPEDAAAFLDWGRDFAGRRMQAHAGAIIEGLARPPRLPGYWTAARRLLGLEGQPNI
ncbi:DUF6206 family protein [Tropicimonas sp. IMCC34043]|uniref:DUF6206 family protein n=1 Tax=Tropicimonas sp. IMCC34043 TaxID=2248760 RepID=UPI000E243A8C|nr:DUF6206 family protein [Tropicimonas sp. IMCC34043]